MNELLQGGGEVSGSFGRCGLAIGELYHESNIRDSTIGRETDSSACQGSRMRTYSRELQPWLSMKETKLTNIYG